MQILFFLLAYRKRSDTYHITNITLRHWHTIVSQAIFFSKVDWCKIKYSQLNRKISPFAFAFTIMHFYFNFEFAKTKNWKKKNRVPLVIKKYDKCSHCQTFKMPKINRTDLKWKRTNKFECKFRFCRFKVLQYSALIYYALVVH